MPRAVSAHVTAPERSRVGTDSIRIGKDVIELLTSGMYLSPVTIYREYVQNAADSIDAARERGVIEADTGQVSIGIDHAARTIVISDNGLGISAIDAASCLVAIGDSPKRRTQARGFRGVGRLSGLAYCRELEFRTKAAGEKTVTSITWDCRGLRSRLADGAFNGDLRRIISDSVSVWIEEAEDSREHFFDVHMRDVARLRQDLLLNERIVHDYLAQVSPLSFASEFSSGPEIESKLGQFGVRVPMALTVMGEPVYRPYRNEFRIPGSLHSIRFEGVEFLEFANIDGDVGAVGWLSHHDYTRSIPTGLGVRGIRGRIGDIQIGDANLFDEIFKEARFNGWSVGEIHVLDRRIVPNARRDNFEINHHSYNLLTQLAPVAAKITQRCRSSSISRNAAQIIANTVKEVEARLVGSRRLARAERSRLLAAVQRCRAKLKSIAEPRLRSDLTTALERAEELLQARPFRSRPAIVALDEAMALITKHVKNRTQADKLAAELRRICV